jgi:hypothetical protein
MKNDLNNMFFQGPQGFPQMGPGMGGPGFPGMIPNMNQLENRVASLERQVRRLDARVTRLETPYPAQTPIPTPYGQQGQFQGTEISEQPYTYPYQTSMQVM